MLWKTHLRLSLVLFFLLFTVADLAVPGFCQTDDHREAVLDSDGVAGGTAAFADSMTNAPKPPSDSAPISKEDDCFCCCSHLMMHTITLDMPLHLRDEVPFSISIPLPLPSTTSVYHPPRIA